MLKKQSSMHSCVERIVDGLNSATTNELGKGYSQVQASNDMIALNRKFIIDWEHAYVKSEKITKYANGWYSTFFKSL